jgi:TRAP transporter TAXI family solute receptor
MISQDHGLDQALDSKLIDQTKGMFYPITIPANAYPGQAQQVNTAALNNYFVTSIDAPEDVVYRITKAIFTHLKDIQSAHPAAAAINAERALAIKPIEVHPGACGRRADRRAAGLQDRRS